MIAHALAPVWPRAAAAVDLSRRLLGTESRGVALTFDDGPHPEGTPAMLDVLAAAGARATFFMVGEQVERRPALAAEVAAAGHRIALHGFRHRLQARLPESVLRYDYAAGLDALERATAVRPVLHRPPYGIYSPMGLTRARELGLASLLWSRWGKDWRRFTTPARIAARATRNLRAGDVILLHDADFYSGRGSHRHTVEALKRILEQLQRGDFDTVLPV